MPGQKELEILTTEDSSQWMQTLEEIGVYDFYHLPSYHRLAETRGEGQAVMPVYRQGNHLIAFPMLLREIEIPQIPNDLKDATSVYGYAGPVASSNVPDDTLRSFHHLLGSYFNEHKIVCAYSRLNPLTTSIPVLDGFGTTVEIGVTVSIDLSLPSEAQVARYKRGHSNDIRRLKKLGFTCEEVGPEYLDDFIRIYHETMKRVEAEPVYFYDRSYFDYLINEMSPFIHLFVCEVEGNVVSASLTSLCGGIIEALYAGTANDYVQISPSKLLNDYRREWGNSAGAKAVHLGGGGGSQRDSLYEFKMGFGGREHFYSTWRHLADPETYDEICREACSLYGVEPDQSYFPMYRSPLIKGGM